MAAQNWDDHDRSDRYVARDFGANYLHSCEQDAIIFCNGDNDTFPLWYNIEVEGVRTDVRACNLSYLQTDWYIDQMKRPYYESPALPISWEYKDYMPDKNEYVAADDNAANAWEVKKAFQFMLSDDKRTKRDGDNFLPTNKLYILSPDSQQIMLKRANYYTRSDMMVMEMLSTNNWKRPMYFAVTIGNDYHMGLDPYLELTGLAYRITPNRSEDGRPRVNTDLMYDNMINKFSYGNVNKPGVYLDENTLRMCRTHRMMFAQLAEALYIEGMKQQDTLIKQDKHKKVLEVLDYAEKVLPEYNVSYDHSSISMAALYYELGEIEKGNCIIDKVATNATEYIEWGKTISAEKMKSAESTIEQQFAILNYALEYLERFEQKELFNKYYKYYELYRNSSTL
jgi:hypothetical protein